MSKFVKVCQWSWHHYFSGTMSILTVEDATEQQVKSYIGQSTDRGGGGNYDPLTLKSKVKGSKRKLN